jgi:DNA mismatch repair protein MutS
MSQYLDIKERHKDGILLFQVGDFYETFYDDAKEVSRLLNIALTTRDKNKDDPIPLAGVPIHAVETYVAKLLKAGRKVIICDQVESAPGAKGVVKRSVTDVITPGTTLSLSTLPEKENNFIAALRCREETCGFALLDLSTGQFDVGEEDKRTAESMLSGYNIREILIPEEERVDLLPAISAACTIEHAPSFQFGLEKSRKYLEDHFGMEGLSGFGVDSSPLAIGAAGALLEHVKDLRRSELDHVSAMRRVTSRETLFIDSETIRNLELFEPIRGDTTGTTLIEHIDRTRTAMGARLLRRWLMHPSRRLEVIHDRLGATSELHSDQISLSAIREKLVRYPDIERILSRVTTGKAGPRELLSLSSAFERLPGISGSLSPESGGLLARTKKTLEIEIEAAGIIASSIEPESPATLREGGVIRKGFDERLDALIKGSEEGRNWIVSLQRSERERTKIPSLKVGFNKVFGYYIEVSRTHDDKVPDDYVCKQTLVSSQRYVTQELKEREQAILSAEARRIELEREIFAGVCRRISACSSEIQATAGAVALLDVIASLAELALDRDYCRPEVGTSNDLVIIEGRHPVVEVISEKSFIPNDCIIRPEDKQLLIITGPNMGGKSTYIRQAALISILAHMGSFVPASRANIGLMDRVFTRVGSSDNLAKGQSTFLVEMAETAKILHNCTSQSFVILDEVGRGTSTLDGLSIAWAVSEYLIENESARPKTLFATHFHELTHLAESLPRVQNLRVDVKEWGDKILFLYKIREGAGDRSYGIHVAKLAGLPHTVTDRAREILESLENGNAHPHWMARETIPVQGELFVHRNRIKEYLQNIDIENLKPIDALNVLSEILEMTKE